MVEIRRSVFNNLLKVRSKTGNGISTLSYRIKVADGISVVVYVLLRINKRGGSNKGIADGFFFLQNE